MASDILKGIPGVPTAAMDAIQDENARIVLQAIVDGWNVRNGSSGKGDNRFVTVGEMGEQVAKSSIVIAGAGPAFQGGPLSTGISEIYRILTSLQSEIIASEQWRKLGEKIELIDIPNIFSRIGQVESVVKDEMQVVKYDNSVTLSKVTALGIRVGENESGMQTETTMRVNSDNALANAVNKLWATVGGNTGLVSSGDEIVANNLGAIATKWEQVQATIKDPVTGGYLSTATVRDEARTKTDLVENRLTAEKTIKVDVDGYVAGYGIIANKDMTTGATSSWFGVRADKFYVGSPSIGNAIPFIVNTTTDSNGTPPGVYMNSAMIGHASIGTLQLNGEAVFVSRWSTGWAGATVGGGYVNVTTLWLPIYGLPSGASAPIILQAYTNFSPIEGDIGASVYTNIAVNGSVVTPSFGVSVFGNATFGGNSAQVNLGNGSHLIQLMVHVGSPGASSKYLNINSVLIAMSGKR